MLKDIDINGYDTLILDRDGTINVQIIGDYVCKWEDFEFIPGVLDAMSKFAEHFKYIFIVTNQRGIGKGRYTIEQLNDIHSKMISEIEKYGGHIDKIYYCSALSDNDIRRKPNIGMFDDILRDYPDVRPENTLMVGDSDTDMQFAKNCGISGIRINSLKKDRNNYFWI